MPWNATCPVGGNSVKNNRQTIQDNMTFTDTSMKNDHYWSDDAAKAGYHKKVETVNQSADPAALSGVTNCYYYSRLKTAGEAPTVQKSEPFVYTQVGAANHYLQLGFRAMAQFQGRASNGACTLNYVHNITSITRTGTGLYTVTFTNDLPSTDYILFGTTHRFSSSNRAYVSIQNAADKASVMAVGSVKISFQYSGNNFVDPDICMIAICGG